MKATDGLLCELARQAGVRPPHLFHLIHYRKAMGDRFSIGGYAAFARIEPRHVQSMLAVLDAQPVVERKRRAVAAKTQLSADWQMPEDWLVMGRERRFWTMDVCRTEADRFANHHRAKGSIFADWKCAWRNWIDGSFRENGSPISDTGRFDSEENRRAYLASLK